MHRQIYLHPVSAPVSLLHRKNTKLPQLQTEEDIPSNHYLKWKLPWKLNTGAQFASNLAPANNALWTIVSLRLLIAVLVATWVSAPLTKKSDLGNDTTGTTADSASISVFLSQWLSPVLSPVDVDGCGAVADAWETGTPAVLGLPCSWRCLLMSYHLSSVGPWQ